MKLSNDELLPILRRKEEAAGAYVWGSLGDERKEALEQYYRQPYGNEEEGWSQIVSSDIQDSVEWVLPSLIDIFTSTDKVVQFDPSRAEDVQPAEQATDACNYVFNKQNNGFLILYTAIKDMLISRNCAVMWSKQKKQVVNYLPFKQMPAEALAMSMQDGDEIIESGIEQVLTSEGQPVELISGRIKRTEEKQSIKVEAFPPDQLLIDRDWSSPLLDDCPYVCRMARVTVSDLKQMGFDVEPKDLKESDGAEYSADASARFGKIDQDDDGSEYEDEEETDALTEGWLRIEFVLVDQDGDGIAERRVIYRLRDKILSNEECDAVQIATASPILNTHRWDGMSWADLIADLQKLHTELLRQTLNNLYLTNNPRTKVLTDANWSPLANIDDLLDSRPGAVVRQRDINAVSSEVTPFAAGASLPVLEYVQQMRENRTGVSRTSQGLNPDALNATATGRMIDVNSSLKRVELVARIIAEVLLKPVFKGILKLLTDGTMEKLAFRLRNEFVEYDPNEWRDGYDMTINVGLGSGDKAQQIAKLQTILMLQKELLQLDIATPQNIYHASSKLIEATGFKDTQNFLTDPATIPPKPPQPPLEVQLKQMELSSDQQTQVLRHKEKLAEIQANLQVQEANDIRDAEKQVQKSQLDAQIEELKLRYEDNWKNLQAQVDIYVAELGKASQASGELPTLQNAPSAPASPAPVVVNIGGAKRKTAKAVKQPDGSYIMESFEQDIEDTGVM